ncbi:transglycosylase SLT domain-containing protein [Salmonella sp. NW826]|uniref:transglycosylase SLT domain-containing protein n=1 Tax=Salmonella sp. NW826 TaxID=2948311 RepID=UPI003F684416
MGLIQIDSQHFAALKRYSLTPWMLFIDSCTNIFTGIHYLALSFRKIGKIWQAAGGYYADLNIDSIQY